MATTGTDSELRDEAVKVGNPVIFNMPPPASYSSTAVTYLAADIVGGIIVHDTTGQAATGTLPSPDSLAALVDNPRVGDVVECLIVNGGSAGAITLTAPSGSVTFDTNQKSGSQVIATQASKWVLCRFTNVTAGSRTYVVYS